jgi:hypothetical protein
MDECWQYRLRKQYLESDIAALGFNADQLSQMRVKDFVFANESPSKEITDFILKYEWLGSMAQQTSHCFTARYRGILAGVITLGTPNTFSKILGPETKKMERLISRGACASWTPKNLASALIMWSLRWMVKNTPYRVFVGYSDSEAGEQGTIYQACSFYYLGDDFGTGYLCLYNGKWISPRSFTTFASFRKYARKYNLPWEPEWKRCHPQGINVIPKELKDRLMKIGNELRDSCEKKKIPHKRKYVCVLGANKSEARSLVQALLKYTPRATKKYPLTKTL